jgi:hypothetical protein
LRSGVWACVEVEEAGGEVHVDALVGGGEGDEEGLDVGDEDLVAGGGDDGEERGGVGEAAAAVGGCGEVDGGDGSDEGGAVEDLAVEQVVDVFLVFGELDAVFVPDDQLELGEGFGLLDGVDAGEVENDAALVAADGEPVSHHLDGAGFGGGACEVGGSEVELVALGEAGGEVGEEFGEDLSLTTLGAQEVGEDGPGCGCVWGLIAHSCKDSLNGE